MDIQHSLPLTTFYSARKKYRIKLQEGFIVWDNAKLPYAENLIPVRSVVAVNYNLQKRSEEAACKQFTIHFVEKITKNNRLRLKSLILNHLESLQVTSWVSTLQYHLDSFSHRPKNLLLLVNPYGGSKSALHNYEKYGKPLFEIAGVDVTVVVSQKQNQIKDFVYRQNLSTFDAVGCVGGDGTVCELVNGLILKECRLRGIDPDDPLQQLPRPDIPVGFIPGGSTDATAYCIYGTIDVTTAVLHIILGETVGLDVVSVHDGNGLLRLFASALSYGYLGDIVHFSEQLRWMGSARYEYTGFKKIIANKGYEGKITLLADPCSTSDNKCYENCEECYSRRQIQSRFERSNDEDNWKTIEGKFFMVSGANVSCAGERNPHGLAPFSHLGDGYLHLVLMRHTSLVQNLRTVGRFMSNNSFDIDDLPHVEVHRTKEFCFRAKNSSSRWNCDGEVIHNTDIRARVHCQLLTVFGRGMPRPYTNTKQCCRM